MRKSVVEDAGFKPKSEESPVFRWGEQADQSTPAETARRDMREIDNHHAAALRRALDEAGFKTPNNA
jgi:hypothetical protein